MSRHRIVHRWHLDTATPRTFCGARVTFRASIQVTGPAVSVGCANCERVAQRMFQQPPPPSSSGLRGGR